MDWIKQTGLIHSIEVLSRTKVRGEANLFSWLKLGPPSLATGPWVSSSASLWTWTELHCRLFRVSSLQMAGHRKFSASIITWAIPIWFHRYVSIIYVICISCWFCFWGGASIIQKPRPGGAKGLSSATPQSPPLTHHVVFFSLHWVQFSMYFSKSRLPLENTFICLGTLMLVACIFMILYLPVKLTLSSSYNDLLCLLWHFCLFCHTVWHVILVPQPRIKPGPPAVEAEYLTTGKSLLWEFLT